MTKVDPTTALDNFFSVIRDRAVADPEFARSLCDAIGATVVFRGEEAANAVDPVMEARHGVERFRETFLSFPAKDLKRLLKDYSLASPQDMKGKSKAPQLVDLLWERASQKLNDLRPS